MSFSRRRITCFGSLLFLALVCVSLMVYAWQSDPRQRYRVDTSERMTTLAFSPDGTLLATGAPSGMIVLWRAATGERVQTLNGHTATITDLAFRPDGAQLVSVSEDQTIRRWDFANGTLLIVPDPYIVATRPADPSQWWGEFFQRVAWSEDGLWMAAATNNGRVFLIDASSGHILNVIQAYVAESSIYDFGDLSLNHAHGILLTSGVFGDNRTKLWAIPSGTMLAAIDDETVNQVYYMVPDRGRVQMSADGLQVLRINKRLDVFETWDTTGKQLAALPSKIQIDVPPHGFVRPSVAVSYALSQNGDLLAIGGGILNNDTLFFNRIDGSIKLWKLGQSEPIVTLQGHTNVVTMVAFSPDMRQLASIGWDNTLRLWDLTP